MLTSVCCAWQTSDVCVFGMCFSILLYCMWPCSCKASLPPQQNYYYWACMVVDFIAGVIVATQNSWVEYIVHKLVEIWTSWHLSVEHGELLIWYSAVLFLCCIHTLVLQVPNCKASLPSFALITMEDWHGRWRSCSVAPICNDGPVLVHDTHVWLQHTPFQ